ncbi:MAG: tRNA preQ1(34) S-adenosylmethionine ribosyltransferase-isomerase QueA [Pedosphaera sp.]|nr:tRNA preQ1(34) S-adenosylmethionine ribosyltransferase-isomerase QueA [Pedosphaera sp.]
MQTTDFDYSLPPDRIAQHPTSRRDGSRLLVLHRTTRTLEHRDFTGITECLRAGDVLVVNNSRVIPARLRGYKEDTRGLIEILLLDELTPTLWRVMLRPGKRVRPGTRLLFTSASGAGASLTAEVVTKEADGHCCLQFSNVSDVSAMAWQLGEMPLPPYIHRPPGASAVEDRDRYQTVYAQHDGSVAAPTAGLHFTPALLQQLRDRGILIREVTLHVGHGTFAPVKTENIEQHVMHEERYDLPLETAQAVTAARRDGRRVIAVGTTSVRVLESAARAQQNAGHVAGPFQLKAAAGRTRIFIHPPAGFLVVDGLLTNFHLPRSTLLMLVSALAAPGELALGRDWILCAYAEAIREGYRFFSYGDAMLIL